MVNKRQELETLRAALDNERSSFIPHWRELGDYILPRRPRLTLNDVNKGDKRNQKIIDSTATMSARTLRSGMMSGVTSPARPWFRLTTPDPRLAEVGSVKEWLHTTSQDMATVFLRSNLYNVLPTVYGDLGVFATGAMLIQEDFKDVLRFQSLPIGSYMIALSKNMKVEVFMREFRMTVRQLVEEFGERNPVSGKLMWDNFSAHVKNMYDQKQLEVWVDVVHVIKPNNNYDPNKPTSKYKKFESCYYERGYSGGSSSNYLRGPDDNIFLKESGYDYFPVLCPRWETTGEDVYGTECPGMTALGDIKQLQLGEKKAAQAIEKMVNPPMTAPTSMRNSKASILPGDISYVDVREGQQGFRAAHEINFRINELEMKQDQIRNRIQRCFYEDLFLMLASSDRRQITAREIEERHEEKLLALGPVLEQLNQDLLDPLIDITFQIMLKQGIIKPPPEELQGERLKVEYISIMAQAQKLVGISAVERFTGFVGQVAAFSPEALDKIDVDQAIDVYGDMTSVPPSIIRSDEAVQELRASRAQAQQAQAQAQMMQQSAMAAKDLSQADMEGDNALTRMIDQANSGSLVET